MNLGKLGKIALHGWLFALVLIVAGCGQAPDSASDTDATAESVAVETPEAVDATDQSEVTAPDQVSVKMCGGIAGLTCDADEYCHYTDGMCGMADLPGECRPMPQFCTTEYDPYCGCDGNTYGNRCDTHAVGQSIRHKGACVEPEG